MKKEVNELLKKIDEDVKYRNILETTLDSLFNGEDSKYFNDYNWKIDQIAEVNLARLELSSAEYFCSTKYMDLNLFIYCAIIYFGLYNSNPQAILEHIASQPEFLVFPPKAITVGIDMLYEHVMEEKDGV